MGDEDQPIRERDGRDGRDEKVHAPDRLTIAFEIGADARTVFGCEIVKIERDELSQKTILCGAVLRDLRALERSVNRAERTSLPTQAVAPVPMGSPSMRISASGGDAAT